MSEEWKQPVIVENKPGAGTTIAAAYVAGSPPDGYTLLLIGPASHAVSSALYRNLPYDALKSFAGVGQVASAPFVVVVNPATKINTMKELIELARSKPGQVSYSSSGSGASPHLATEMIAMATGTKLLHVPFKGASPATVALLGAQVDFSVADSSVIPFIQSAKLRALAVTTASQSPLFPGVPTLAEAGVPGVEVPLATGILAPAGTPREVILKINSALTRAVGGEDVRRRLNALGFEPAPKSPEEFSAFLASEVQKYTKIVNAIGLKID
jgi:tripartite-type tricarboxylate transporter receptor subunit TctC